MISVNVRSKIIDKLCMHLQKVICTYSINNINNNNNSIKATTMLGCKYSEVSHQSVYLWGKVCFSARREAGELLINVSVTHRRLH